MTVTRKALRAVVCRACPCVRYAAGFGGRFGGVMRAGTYYAIAAVLVLATLPMYRYIFQRARELDRPQSSPVVQVLPVVVGTALSRVDQQTRVPLLPGELCEGGVVVLVSGNAYTQAVDASGHPVRCEPGFLLR